MLERLQRSVNGRLVEVAGAGLAVGLFTEAAADPLEPTGMAWVVFAGVLAVFGVAAAGYVARGGDPVWLSQLSPDVVAASPTTGFFLVSGVVSLVGLAVTADPSVWTVALLVGLFVTSVTGLFGAD